MNKVLPSALVSLIDALGVLPGVGQRTAERYAYYLLRQDKSASRKILSSLEGIHDQIKLCPVTFSFINSYEDVSPLYSDAERDKSLVAVVEDPFDVIAIENTGGFFGTYHVLGGAISPIDGIGPEKLHIPELIKRLKDDGVKELILATNPSVEGESTAIYIQKQLEDAKLDDIKVTRLARGLPSGVDLAYADQITLSHALAGRKAL
jgi:recombination protein RecR